MDPIRRAVIDVGTNSIKVLVADVAGSDVRPVREESHQTRLGRGFYKTHRLTPEAITATASAVAGFAELARGLHAESVRVLATSAARDARNPLDLTSAIEKASGLKVQIISGEQEAELAFRGVSTDPRFAGTAFLLLEVGGGSCQFILGHGGHAYFRRSYPLGTVRLLEATPHGDPPEPEALARCRDSVRQFLAANVGPELQAALTNESAATSSPPIPPATSPTRPPAPQAPPPSPVQLVGTGGTATILGCMEAKLERFDRARLESTQISLARLTWHVDHLWGMPLEARKNIVGLPSNRADVILTGAIIYEGILKYFCFEGVQITTRGLRFAAVMDSK